jgi:hypothetical protein
LYLGGSWRKVVIDDRIAVNELGISLFLHYQKESKQELLLWPLILSKALLKVAFV